MYKPRVHEVTYIADKGIIKTHRFSNAFEALDKYHELQAMQVSGLSMSGSVGMEIDRLTSCWD